MKCEWKKVPIESLCTGIYDGPHATPPKSDSGAVFLGISNFSNGRLDLSNIRYISEDDLPRWTKRVTPKAHDIVFSYEATLNLYAIVPEGFYGCLGRRMALMRPDESKVDYRFLYYYMYSSQWREEIERHTVNGSTVDRIPLVSFPSFAVNLPNMATQKYIAETLFALDEKIELNNKINENLERQAQAIYHEQFETINKDELPVGWRVVALGDVAVINKKSFNPAKEPEIMLEHYSIPAFDESHFPVFELSTAIKSNKFVVDNDCFMISKLNPTTKRIWKPYCLTENAVCSTEFIVYKAKDSTITDFLYSVIDSVSFSDFMCSHVTGSTGSRQRTTPSDTLSFEFVLPSENKLNSFQTLVSPMYAQMRINSIENDKLKQLRDSLLPKLMSGDIDTAKIDT